MGDSTRVRSEVYFQGGIELGSNGITNGALIDYFNAEFLDEALKLRLIENLSDKNSIGSIQDYEVGFRQWTDSAYNNWRKGYGIHYAVRSRFGARSSKEALELVLFGNARFAGQTVDVLPLDNTNLTYSELGFTHFQRNKDWSWSVSGNLLIGHAYSQLETETGTLYTEPQGEYLDLDAKYRYRSADNLLWLKGLGASVHAELTYDPSGPWSYRFALRDFGLMFWGRSSYEINADSTFRFEGDEIPNLLDGAGLDFGNTQDRFESSFNSQESGAFTSFLPMRLQAEVGRDLDLSFSNKVSWQLDYAFLDAYRLRNRFKLNMPLNEAWTIVPEVSQGGWAKWGAGISAQWKNPDWRVQFDISNVQGVVIPASTYGLGGFLSLAYRL